ncbi:MAG: T9SS type A sorting domain-containing protein [Bacteroidota bacterium]
MENFLQHSKQTNGKRALLFCILFFLLIAPVLSSAHEWDLMGPTFDNCNTVSACNTTGQCDAIVDLVPIINSDCLPANGLAIDYKIDLDDDNSDDLLGYSDNQGSTYPFPNPNGLPVTAFSASSPTATASYPVGTHRIYWNATDDCGNTTSCDYTFIVEDCEVPVPYCEIGVSIVPLDSGQIITVFASDFDLGSTDNCVANGQLGFSFSTDPNDISVDVSCADHNQVQNYTIYVWDDAGNFSTCIVSLMVDCPNVLADIVAKNERGEAIGGFSIEVTGANGQSQVFPAAPSGLNYNFLNLLDSVVSIPGPYDIRPVKDINPVNGVSTFDLVLLARHILGIEPLNSPYRMIAADVNRSSTITVFDLVQLRQLILFQITDFTNNDSWRFIPEEYDFNGNPTNPFAGPIPDSYTIDSFSLAENLCFIGVKVGDLNGTAVLSGLTSEVIEDRQMGQPLRLQAEDQPLVAGQDYAITFSAQELEQALGLQLALRFDPSAINIDRVVPAALPDLNLHNFNLDRLDQGELLASWSTAHSASIDGESVFTLHFRALKDTHLSSLFTLSTESLSAEAYSELSSGQVSTHPVELHFSPPPPAPTTAFELMANRPNPFRQQTLISFTLPEAGAATLQVFDALGRLVYQREDTFAAGYNEFWLQRGDLGAAGLYYYQLNMAELQAKQRMVLVD